MNKCLTSTERASLLVKAMSLPQKIQQISGNIDDTPFCAKGVRHVAGIPALEVPLFRITNGPVGIGGNDCSDKATAFPSSIIGMAASFDPTVAASLGTTMATEASNLGYQEIEGPGMNLARNPQGGTNFEYLGEDPFLAGTMSCRHYGSRRNKSDTEQECNRNGETLCRERTRDTSYYEEWLTTGFCMSCTCCHSKWRLKMVKLCQ